MEVLFGEKVPVPEDDHTPPEATVKEPVNATDALFAQTVWLLPALAVGPGVMVRFITLVTGLQPPLFAEVSVKVTRPAEISAALGT
jgi:hypothetical protein